MECQFCGKETKVTYYEIGGVVDCGRCRDTRSETEKLQDRVAELEAFISEVMDTYAEILAPMMQPKYTHRGCAIAGKPCSSSCPYFSEFVKPEYKAPTNI